MKAIRLLCFNLVIQPVEDQSPEAYEKLFHRIFEIKTPIEVGRDKLLSMGFLEKSGNLVRGILYKYDKSSEASLFDSSTGDIEQVDFGPNKHQYDNEYEFYLNSKTHTLYVDEKLSYKQTRQFFETSISMVRDYLGFDVKMHTVSNKKNIQQIIEAKNLQSLHIRISYSNGDNYDNWMGAWDEEMKESNIGQLDMRIKSVRGENINVQDNDMLKAALHLSARHGDAYAIEKTEEGQKKYSTNDSPEIIDVEYEDLSDKIDAISKLSPE